MSRIIIKNSTSNINDVDSLTHTQTIIQVGRISNEDNGDNITIKNIVDIQEEWSKHYQIFGYLINKTIKKW